MAKSNSPAEIVREIAQRLGRFTPADIRREQPCRNGVLLSGKRVRAVLHDFLEAGEVRRVEQYEYVESKAKAANAGVRERVYRAMHVQGSFTARDIHVLSDAGVSYLYTLMVRLLKAGDIEKCGPVKGATRASFRVRNRDEFFLKYVRKEGSRAETQGRRG